MFLEKEVRAKFCIITRSKRQLSITYQCLKNLLLKKIIMIEVSPQVPFVSCIGRACSDHPVTQFRLSCGQDYLPHSRNCDGLTTGLQMNALETLSQGPATCSMSSLVTEPETVKVLLNLNCSFISHGMLLASRFFVGATGKANQTNDDSLSKNYKNL